MRDVEEIARDADIRDLARLVQNHGPGEWRKVKGWARASHVVTGDTYDVEVHWYEVSTKRVEQKVSNWKRVR